MSSEEIESQATAAGRTACVQCDLPATVYFEKGFPLCLEHAEQMQRMVMNGQAMSATWINYLRQQIHQSFPFSDPAPVLRVAAPLPAPSRITTHINVSGGNVGAINTGTVANLNVELTALQDTNQNLADLLTEFGKTVYDSDLEVAVKNEVGEQLAFLLEQLRQNPEQRHKSIAKRTVSTIGESIRTAAAATALWMTVGPVLITALGIG